MTRPGASATTATGAPLPRRAVERKPNKQDGPAIAGRGRARIDD
jgi:hypothetical protein